jgi:hypothetical protein
MGCRRACACAGQEYLSDYPNSVFDKYDYLDRQYFLKANDKGKIKIKRLKTIRCEVEILIHLFPGFSDKTDALFAFTAETSVAPH